MNDVGLMKGIEYVIVENDSDHALLLRRNLKRICGWGEPTREFSDPELAIEYLRANPVALVLSDTRMPKMWGPDMYAQLKNDGYSGLIVGMSEHDESGDLWHKVEAHAFFSKRIILDRARFEHHVKPFLEQLFAAR